MLSRARRALATIDSSSIATALLIAALVVLVALSTPARAGEGDQGPLELLGDDEIPFDDEFPDDFDVPEDEGVLFGDPSAELFPGPAFGEPGFDGPGLGGPGLPPDVGPEWDPVLTDRALQDLLLEIALLDHLDAFSGQQPIEFSQIHNAYGPWPADTTRDDVVGMLFAVDDRLAETKNDVWPAFGNPPSLRHALDEIPAAQRARISDGGIGVVDPLPYTTALHDLLSFGDARNLREIGELDFFVDAVLPPTLEFLASPADINDLRAEIDQLGTQAADLGQRLDAIDGQTGDGQTPWLTIAAIAIAGLLFGALVTALVLRRRRIVRPPHRDRVTELIWEAHRRLSGATEEQDVVLIATTTATIITDSLDAYLFRVTEDGLRRSGEEGVIVHTALLRVLETAQPLLTELESDAAVGTAAICAVPLVSDATMAGILVARREPDRPYGTEDRHRLELLAPALGGALLSADQLDSFENLAMVDGLTALGNRRRLDGDLETTLAEAVANDLPVAFAMIDVDHFKHFNDTHGHEAGDVALQTVARLIERNVRATDVVYRYGGEEFSVLLPAATVEEARLAGERIRAAIESAGIAGGERQPGGRLTVSVGISTLESGPPEGLKSRADEALYEAKAQGRNRSVLA